MIRGTERKYEPRHIDISQNVNIHNRFDIEVRDATTNQLKQKAQAFNVICNNFWSNLSSYSKYIVYSDGTGTPSASDINTFGTARYASSSAHETIYSVKKGVTYRTWKVVLSETTAVGVNITEVGLSALNTSGYLCTHAMVQDMNGNPISIKKTNTDIITIYATVYVHFVPSGYDEGTIVLPPINGVIYRCLGSSSDMFGRVHAGKGTCGWTYTSSTVSATYNSTSKTITGAIPRFTVDQFNIAGGFGWIGFGDYGTSCIIDVRGRYEIVGEAVGTGDGTTCDFATKFDFPSDAIVYVDGVPKTSGVTVKNEPITTDALRYLVGMYDTLYDGKPVFKGGRQALSYANTNAPQYFYNTQHALGIYKIHDHHYAYLSPKLSFSDDFVNWSDYYYIGDVIPEEYRHCKYVRALGDANSTTHSGYLDLNTADFPPSITGKNIVFDEPPAEGSVITIDYITPFVPKDSNHVYDLSFTIQLGEYSGS